MKIGNYSFKAEVVPETKDEIDNIREQAELYGLSFSEYLLFLIHEEVATTGEGVKGERSECAAS